MSIAAHAGRMAWTADEIVMRPRAFTVKREMVSKESVDYRPASSTHHCGNCVMFHEDTFKCDLVKGHIEADGVCDKWEAGAAEKSFKPDELRDDHGRWIKVGDDARSAVPKTYTSTSSQRQITSESVTDKESAAAYYTSEGHKLVNDRLRRYSGDISQIEHGSGNPKDPDYLHIPNPSLSNVIRHLDSAFGESTTTHPIMVYRGVKGSKKLFSKPLDGSLVGAKWTDHGYVSTATDENAAKPWASGSVIMRLHVHSGTPAVNLPSRAGENEILLGRGLEYTVTGDDQASRGLRTLDVTVRTAGKAEKARRIVGLNGQETWADGDNGPPYPASGGGAPLPPGGVPGATAGGEPPRWDGGQPEPRTESAPDDEDDALAPTEGRVAPASRGGVGFPATYMDGYWPGGGHGTQQAGTSSPGGERGVPPSTVRGKEKVRLSDLVKVGPEGYIHGFICVRPPCGPRYTEAKFDSSKGSVEHEGSRIGKMRKNADGTYSMAHHRGDSTKAKLDAKYATRADAARSVALYHNLDVLHDHAADTGHAEAAAKVLKARDALAAGDHDAAQAAMVSAELEANKAGDSVLATHLVETRAALVTAPKPVNTPPEPADEEWGKHFAGEAPVPVPVPHVPEEMHNPSAPGGIAPVPTPSLDDADKPISGITTNPSLLEQTGARLAREYRRDGEPADSGNFGAKLLSKWDLSTFPERIAAEDSGAQWYKQVRSVVRGAGPHNKPLYRGMTMDRMPQQGESIRVPLSNWTEDSRTASNYGNITLHLPQDEPAMDVHALGADDPMSNFVAGGGSFNVERVDNGHVYLTRKPVSKPSAAAEAATSTALPPVHEPEPPAELEVPRPTAVKSVVPVSKDPPSAVIDAYDEIDRLQDEIYKLRQRSSGYGSPENAQIFRLNERVGYLRDGHTLGDEDWTTVHADTIPGMLTAAGMDPSPYGNDAYKAQLLSYNRRARQSLAAEEGVSLEEMDQKMVQKLKDIAAKGHVATRVTNAGLEHILDDNAFKTQFETGRSKALKANDVRAGHEGTWFGYDKDMDPSLRPFYGYVTEGPDRQAGIGSRMWPAFETDHLSSFGTTQVVFKDSVKQRTSMNVGDSLTNKAESMPSPMLDPDARSFGAYDTAGVHGGLNRAGMIGFNRDVTAGDFRAHSFVEAQLHSADGSSRPVAVTDIDHVLFDKTPPASLRAKLDDKGIPWKVWNAKAIAKSGTPEEKSRALEVAKQDIAHADEEIAFKQQLISKQLAKNSDADVADWRSDITNAEKVKAKLQDDAAALEKAGAR